MWTRQTDTNTMRLLGDVAGFRNSKPVYDGAGPEPGVLTFATYLLRIFSNSGGLTLWLALYRECHEIRLAAAARTTPNTVNRLFAAPDGSGRTTATDVM